MASLPILSDVLPHNLPSITMRDTGYDPSSLPQISGLTVPSVLGTNLPVTGLSRRVPLGDPDSGLSPASTAQPNIAGLKRPPPKIGTTVNGYTYMGGDPRSQDPSVWRPATGDTFLNSLPLDDQKKTLVKAIANYDLPPGTQRGSIGSPEVQQLLALAKQYDPTFSASDYAVRQGIRQDFSKGQYSKTVTALNTAIDHARGLAEQSTELGNGSNPAINWLRNTYRENISGDPRPGKFTQTAQLEAGELVKAISGSQGGEEDRRQQEANFRRDGSPAQQRASVTNAVQLLKSKLDELNDTYQRGMGPKHNVFELLSPSARKSWEFLSKNYGAVSHDGSTGTSPTPAPAGVDAKLWQYMTPQERSLWPK